MDPLERELNCIIKQNNRPAIKSQIKSIILMRRSKRRIAFWPNAMAINALYTLNPESKVIKKQIMLWQKHGFRISQYDDILMAYYLITKTNLLTNKQREIIIRNAESSIREYCDEIIPYREADKNLAFIDLLGMVPQFLIYLGVERNDKNLIRWGVLQFDSFIKNAIDSKTKLPYHAYDIKSKQKVGIVGWGRALGWMMTGLADSINELNDSYLKEKERLLYLYESLFDAVIKYQRKDGGFSWQLLDISGPLDTSTTGMILQSMLELKNKSMIVDKNIDAAKQMLDCLDSNYRNGKIINCSAECGGIGIYPQRYGSFAWSVAPYAICKKLSKNILDMK